MKGKLKTHFLIFKFNEETASARKNWSYINKIWRRKARWKYLNFFLIHAWKINYFNGLTVLQSFWLHILQKNIQQNLEVNSNFECIEWPQIYDISQFIVIVSGLHRQSLHGLMTLLLVQVNVYYCLRKELLHRYLLPSEN